MPLKLYFWFATIQLILDVFRKDIMRYIFRIDANRIDHQNIPSRVIFYNLAYVSFSLRVSAYMYLQVLTHFIFDLDYLCHARIETWNQSHFLKPWRMPSHGHKAFQYYTGICNHVDMRMDVSFIWVFYPLLWCSNSTNKKWVFPSYRRRYISRRNR